MGVGRGLTGEDLAPAKNAAWVIVRRHVLGDPDAGVRRYLIENVPWERYERIVIDSPDTMFQNREDPKDHRFRTARDEEPVVVSSGARDPERGGWYDARRRNFDAPTHENA